MLLYFIIKNIFSALPAPFEHQNVTTSIVFLLDVKHTSKYCEHMNLQKTGPLNINDNRPYSIQCYNIVTRKGVKPKPCYFLFK